MLWINDMAVRRNNPGFTLIEALIATTVLATGVLGIAEVLSISSGAASRACRLSEASSIAENQLELAVLAPSEQLEPNSGIFGRYGWEVNYSAKPHGLVMATVLVKWQDKGSTKNWSVSQVFLPYGTDE